jgi:7-keto-8-aminopelargonate synthetase-like enzyme
MYEQAWNTAIGTVRLRLTSNPFHTDADIEELVHALQQAWRPVRTNCTA